MVPDDFGVHGRNFTYGYHRLSNIQEWQAFRRRRRGGAVEASERYTRHADTES